MSKLIIVEGPDCCGKSTLAQDIARFYRGMLFHCTASKALFPALPDYHRNIMDNVELNIDLGNTVVLDRFWPSEMAYGYKLFRPDSGYDIHADQLVERIAKFEKMVYIFCFSVNGWRRYKQGHIDPAHSLTDEQYRQVWINYEQVYQLLYDKGFPTAMYQIEIDGDSPEKLATFLGRIDGILKSK